jgi:hypothetical protein
MAQFEGFGELQTPRDLVRKLQHDLARMESSPYDQFAAFDFFVTAEHIVDWEHPTSKAKREAVRASNALLRVTSHVANGAKHFSATAKHHKSVSGVEKDRYAEPGYFAEDYAAEPLVIGLTDVEAKEIGGSSIEAIELARRVLAYWNTNLAGA